MRPRLWLIIASTLVGATACSSSPPAANEAPEPDLIYEYSGADLSTDPRNQELLEFHMLYLNGASNDLMHQPDTYVVRWPRVAEFEIELHGPDAVVCSATVVDRANPTGDAELVVPGTAQRFVASGRQLVRVLGGCDSATVRAWESNEPLSGRTL